MRKSIQIALISVVAFAPTIFAQVQTTIDSLRQTLSNTNDPTARVIIYNELVGQWAEANFDSAYRYAGQMLLEAQRVKDAASEAKAFLALGVVYDYQNQIDSAKHYYSKAGFLSGQLHDDEGAARADFNLATLEYASGNYIHAIEVYRRTEQLFRALKNERALATILNNLGEVYLATEQFEAAKEAFKQSIDLKKKNNNIKGQLNSLTNLSITYQKSGNYVEAEKISKATIELAKENGDSLAYRNELINIGRVYKKLNKNEVAIQHWTTAEALLHTDDPEVMKGVLWISLAGYYTDKKDFERASSYLLLAEKISSLDQEIRFDLLDLYVRYYSGKKNFKSAFDYQKKLMDERSKQTSEAVRKKVKEYEILFETERRERQIATLEVEKKETDLALQQRAFQRNIFIGIAVAFLTIALLIFKQYRQKQKMNMRLAIALADREILLKEIHHRVKNNLQVISSLLNLQSKSAMDKSAQDAVMEGRNRVKSMSMIHEHLYQKENLAGIAMPAYIEELCESLMRSYGMDAERVQLKLNVEDISLDVDTAIPLGLILNELMTNSLKYAFPSEGKGEIQVQLRRVNSFLSLKLLDNGIGKSQKAGSTGFGMELVSLLAEKLKATISFANQSGTTIELNIAKFKIIEAV